MAVRVAELIGEIEEEGRRNRETIRSLASRRS
jgi:hypothetical protein